jgi:hypothetical protein
MGTIDPAVVEFSSGGGSYSLRRPVTAESCLSEAEAAELLQALNSRPPTADAVAVRLAARAERPVVCMRHEIRPGNSELGTLVRCEPAASVTAQQTVEVSEEGFCSGRPALSASYPLQLASGGRALMGTPEVGCGEGAAARLPLCLLQSGTEGAGRAGRLEHCGGKAAWSGGLVVFSASQGQATGAHAQQQELLESGSHDLMAS